MPVAPHARGHASSRPGLVLVDVQERLLGAFPEAVRDRLVPRLRLLLTAARELAWPVVVTEQYPRGLGPTIAELRDLLAPEWPVVTKTCFSCFGEPAFREALARPPFGWSGAPGDNARDALIVGGIETHVCVQQTVIDALADGFPQVIVPGDAVASRHDRDHDLALPLMARAGATVSSAEAVVFGQLRDARHPAFKPLAALIRDLA